MKWQQDLPQSTLKTRMMQWLVLTKDPLYFAVNSKRKKKVIFDHLNGTSPPFLPFFFFLQGMLGN